MKLTALIAAVALAGGTAAYANQQGTADNANQQEHATAGQKLRGAMHKLGEKTRHALHRAGDKTRQVAKRDHANDTRAMGAAGSSRDAADARQQRMDDAYAHWQEKQHKEANR